MWLLVSFSIPSLMLWSYGTTGTELRIALERHDASTLLECSRHYQQYIQENLVEQVPTDPTEVSISTSCLFCFLYVITNCPSQFKDVGSLIAYEVPKEHADTERTDQETKHAFHNQHALHGQGEASTSATFDDVSLLDRSMYYCVPSIQAPAEQQMYFDTAQLPSFTPPDASTFLHFKNTNFKCQQQSIYITLTCLKDFYHEK